MNRDSRFKNFLNHNIPTCTRHDTSAVSVVHLLKRGADVNWMHRQDIAPVNSQDRSHLSAGSQAWAPAGVGRERALAGNRLAGNSNISTILAVRAWGL